VVGADVEHLEPSVTVDRRSRPLRCDSAQRLRWRPGAAIHSRARYSDLRRLTARARSSP